MRLKDIMESPVSTIRADEPAQQAWERMHLHRIRHLVVTEGRQIVGVISARDLGGRASDRARDGRSVADLMTRTGVVVATPRTTVRQAANLMRGRSIGCLPVVEGDHLSGIVTVTDLLELIGKGAERPVSKPQRWTMAGRGHRVRRRVGP
jgi:acetoin utilization protein AcuB